MRTLRQRGRPRVPIAERFWAKVQKAGPDDCWEWTASKFGHGYGQISLPGEGGGVTPAHRFSYQLEYGPIPQEVWVLHRCDNPGCVNPTHLFLGTVFDNNRDRDEKGRAACGANGLSRKLTAADVHEVVRLYKTGCSQSAIAADFGVAQVTISAILSGRTWQKVTKIPRTPVGLVIPSARLTEDDVRRIFRQRAAGMTTIAIAKSADVSVTTINRVLSRQSWRHVHISEAAQMGA